MKPLFELPELLTLDGRSVTGDTLMGSYGCCSNGCSSGCGQGAGNGIAPTDNHCQN
jgi:hypothetical protein